MIGLTSTARLLKALGDETRMRILNLLAQEELSGTDLMEILNVGQSRISTHLALLKEVGLVVDRRAGRRSYYSVAPGPAAGFWEKTRKENRNTPEFETDSAGLQALRERKKDKARAYFDRVAASFSEELLPGRTWEGLARALMLLAPRARYCDLGVGDGMLTLLLAENALSVTAVDISKEMLSALESRAETQGIGNLETVEGDIEDLPLPEASHDIVVASQALHHATNPERCIAEARRILVPGGRLLVIDLLAHTEEWVRDKLQHVHLGFTEQGLAALLTDAGFQNVSVFRAARDPQPPHFMTLVATGVKP
ncbi:MAG TPA: metalloregulator ArsR/SmtB family transcription factor [Planctomycetes bacterium]|nr:metalloregulator ArsR/SmtB family transcription factor [Planctomycetota bacterium]